MTRTPRRSRRREEPGTIYTVVVLREDDGRYTAYVPALNDCASFGDTLPEALMMVQEAMSLYVATLRDHDWPIPADNPRVTVDMTESPEISVYRLPVRWEAASA
jgi:predicted RNase H-like HicB family nuclease